MPTHRPPPALFLLPALLTPIASAAEAPRATTPASVAPAPVTPAPVTSKPVAPAPIAPVVVTLCGALEAASTRSGLPHAFFARLIWQESRFDPAARSPVGAQGVAQFMPATAAERGLADPFEPARALDESAAYLKDLRERFGNLGLAAAGYNAGPGRVARWLAGRASLPQETLDYVAIVTGHAASEWRDPHPPELDPEPGFSCLAFAGGAGRRLTPASGTGEADGPPPKPWATILFASFNKAAVLAEWQIARAKFADTLGPLTPSLRRRRFGVPVRKYVVQIEADDRASSDRLCKRLEAVGGICEVLRNVLR